LKQASAYLSSSAEHSACLQEQLRKENLAITFANSRLVFEKYLENFRRGNPSASGEKASSLDAVAEALPPVNRPTDKPKETLLSWSAFFRLEEAELGETACSEEEATWLAAILKHSALFAQAFQVKGKQQGDGQPVVLIWRRERGIWRVLTVGAVTN